MPLNSVSAATCQRKPRAGHTVTITTQEEGHYRSFIIRNACVCKRSAKNEQKVQTLWTDDSSSRCHAKRHSSKDHVCWVFIIIRLDVAVLFTDFFFFMYCYGNGLIPSTIYRTIMAGPNSSVTFLSPILRPHDVRRLHSSLNSSCCVRFGIIIVKSER